MTVAFGTAASAAAFTLSAVVPVSRVSFGPWLIVAGSWPWFGAAAGYPLDELLDEPLEPDEPPGPGGWWVSSVLLLSLLGTSRVRDRLTLDDAPGRALGARSIASGNRPVLQGGAALLEHRRRPIASDRSTHAHAGL